MKQSSSRVSLTLVSLLALVPLMGACRRAEEDPGPSSATSESSPQEAASEEDHVHAENPLGTASIGGLEVELAQGDDAVRAGKEAHLVVKLPYSDAGSTVVRAWIGTEDRTLSYVGKGEYAPSHDDYDIHATVPDPLPANPLWWIEIEKPDGTKQVGSAQPILE